MPYQTSSVTGVMKLEYDLGLCLDYNVATRKVQMYGCNGNLNQLWYFDSSGMMHSAQDGRCLDMDSSENVQVYDCHGHSNQRWHFDPNGYLGTAANDKCLDYEVSQKKVFMYRCHGDSNQRWRHPQREINAAAGDTKEDTILQESVDEQLQSFLAKSGAIAFNGYSWDPTQVASNQAIIDGIAKVLKEHPAAGLHLKGVQATKDGTAAADYKDHTTGTPILDSLSGDDVKEQEEKGDQLLTSMARAKSVFVKLQDLGVKNWMEYSGELGSASEIQFVILPPGR
jgi:hypothetical protein